MYTTSPPSIYSKLYQPSRESITDNLKSTRQPITSCQQIRWYQ